MIRIGDFSKLSRVSVKTLRFYDEMGLLKPVEVDRFTGYRYYEFNQLPRLYRILALKDLGFSLEEIGHLLEGDLSAEQNPRDAKTASGGDQAAGGGGSGAPGARGALAETNRTGGIRMSKYDVVIKKMEAIKVASVRGVVPTPPDQRSLWDELMGYLNQQGARMIGPPQAIYHDKEFKERDWDIEVCMPITDELVPDKHVKSMNCQPWRRWLA